MKNHQNPRRTFLKNAALSGALATLTSGVSLASSPSKRAVRRDFNLNYAPHFGMFKNHAGDDFVDQINFMAEQGFPALEDNGLMKRSLDDQKRIGAALEKNGMTMGVFVIDPGFNWKVALTTGKEEYKEAFVKECEKAVEVAKIVNAKWMTVVPGYFERNLPLDQQTAHIIDAYRMGAEVFEPHGLTMVMEPLSDNPHLYLRHSNQAYMICKAVDSPAVKILYDIYHMQRNEGNLIANMELCWEEIAYIQIGDNPGRKEPGTGEINYQNVFKWIDEKGFKGISGMEHGNASPGKEGEQALINAYHKADSFK
ncbi:xylose isomerase [Echinicola strongylocentroti]|uniref:Xylose isomerase n=1 Tax=Echinicola strongylocentroti TaxID=1795355 RepID=A0A2Z4IPU7_9BACT|nr:TIM barrel protein [Echinicola strongylocentroti]AWW32668.1 xylose isomerase [Echinicola strongylocentroti]